MFQCTNFKHHFHHFDYIVVLVLLSYEQVKFGIVRIILFVYILKISYEQVIVHNNYYLQHRLHLLNVN